MLKNYMNKQNKDNSDFLNISNSHHDEQYLPLNRGDDQNRRGKFGKSRSECSEELLKKLSDLQAYKNDLKKQSYSASNQSLSRFEQQYEQFSRKILRQAELQLKQNKQKVMKQIHDILGTELQEQKNIRRNVEKLEEEITLLLQGLKIDSQYRDYIARVVKKDFDDQLIEVRNDIRKIKYPSAHLIIDEKSYRCMKNDMNKIIVLTNDKRNSSRPHSQFPNRDNNDLNMHENRDFIKKHAVSKRNQ